jgi:hypothetical protein
MKVIDMPKKVSSPKASYIPVMIPLYRSMMKFLSILAFLEKLHQVSNKKRNTR